MTLLKRHYVKVVIGCVLLAGVALIVIDFSQGGNFLGRGSGSTGNNGRPEGSDGSKSSGGREPTRRTTGSKYQPRKPFDASGFRYVSTEVVKPWPPETSLAEIGELWKEPGLAAIADFDKQLSRAGTPGETLVGMRVMQAIYWNFEGKPEKAYELLTKTRAVVEAEPRLAPGTLYSLIYLQGLSALRRGENENCILCRGESSCILPLAPAAVHTNPEGSRLAIRHFMEYLAEFPDDLEVRWLLNLAHMTLGEHPKRVDPQFLISLDRWNKSEFDIGKFRDVGHLTKVNRFNQAGGAILDDFDNDGRLDIAVTSWDYNRSLAIYKNAGDGTFTDRSEKAEVLDQLGGLYCVQADYDNDGWLDIYIPRGAWIPSAIRPTLLRNDGLGRFIDVTEEAGLLDPVNSNSAAWADYDNDGWLDLFVCCERQSNRLYRNRGNGTFEEVAAEAGVQQDKDAFCKGAAWFDYDNDNYPDLYLNNLGGNVLSVSVQRSSVQGGSGGRLFRNLRNGKFEEVGQSLGIDGPQIGFSCWAWDYDNDGWLDLFATSYDRTTAGVVQGLVGQPHRCGPNKLYRNRAGQGFEDVTKQAGLDLVFATMGSNYGDFDNDGFLDFYLATGDPNIATLVPNRMFKNVAGRRFAETTASSGTGNLQKGHAVACGDWDRDGDVDVFVEMGGAAPGDQYHNILFQNPGQKNHWLSVKLVGKKSNRSALGARIKLVTAGKEPLTVQRHVSTGSSFGANTLEQHLGLGKAKQVATLEVHWPTSDTTQVFRDIPADQAIEITEFAEDYRVREYKPISLPKE